MTTVFLPIALSPDYSLLLRQSEADVYQMFDSLAVRLFVLPSEALFG